MKRYIYFISYWDTIDKKPKVIEVELKYRIIEINQIVEVQKDIEKTLKPFMPGRVRIFNFEFLREKNEQI